MTQSVHIPWGKGSLSIGLPTKWRILGELKPNGSSGAIDSMEACARGIMSPIGAERLASRDLSGKKVLVVVDDHSRPTPVAGFLPAVLNELSAAGVSKESVEFLIATGVHRASRPDEVANKLGNEIMASYKWTCHNGYESSSIANLGTTSRGTKVFLNRRLLDADLIVCVGAIEPHLLLGFGGGLKMIIPGCAGAETIGRNHLQGVDPEHFNYVGTRGENSPMRQDLEEGALLLRRDMFIVNAAMNEQAKPIKFFCGDPIMAQREGERFLEDTVRLEVPEQADVVIANSFPMDADLRQSVKCIGNTLYASKPGGIMMGFARSLNGLGEMPLAKKTLPYPVMRTLLKVIGKKRLLPLVKKAKRDEPVEEVFIGHFALQMLRRNHISIFSDSHLLPADIGARMGIARSFTDIPSIIKWAKSKAPSSASVWVFPYGGATYAAFEH
ncbi:MAG: nickel-dependent lactate racemase [Desulfomonilaceae bacterium]